MIWQAVKNAEDTLKGAKVLVSASIVEFYRGME